MKSKFLLTLSIFSFNLAISIYPQNNPSGICGSQVNQIEPPIPAYLSDYWTNTRRIQVAVLYVDFPDGRINGTQQPFFTYQLAQINDTDAAAEIGLDVVNGDTTPVCSKYTYFDRWNMYFDSLSNYYGSNHPDWVATKDTAWGSFKEYWKEVSNSRLIIEPALIRPYANGDSRFKTGMINNYVEIETGRFIIESVRLKKNKYQRSGNSYGYFTNYPYTSNEAYIEIGTDALLMLDSLRAVDPSNYPFDHRNFISSGGKIIIVMAGGGTGLGGATSAFSGFLTLRGRNFPLVNRVYPVSPQVNMLNNSRMDGIGVSCHEFGHATFGWAHTYSSRYDVMDGNTNMNVNSPPHPNPIYKMKQGWLQPIAIENSQQLTNLSAIENSYQCGVITIFGKPSAAPDWSTGESYVIENRRMLKFDRKIIDTNFFRQNPDWGAFTGGLLIWHYSPYHIIHNAPGSDYRIRLKTPRIEDSTIAQNFLGDVRHFFAFLPFQLIQDSTYYNFFQNRTYSANGLQTGIELTNITHSNSNISSNIYYTIAPPRHYSDVIYYRDYNRHKINFSDTIFYHEYDVRGFFNFQPGTIIESSERNGIFQLRNIECHGLVNSPVIFKGVGYNELKSPVYLLRILDTANYSDIDSTILTYLAIQNSQNTQTFTQIYTNGFSQNLLLKGIQTTNINIYNSVNQVSTNNFGEISLNNINFSLTNGINFFNKKSNFSNGNIQISQTDLNFEGSNSGLKLSEGTNLIFTTDTLGLIFRNGASVSVAGVTFNTTGSNKWKGIILNNSGTDSIINCTFSNAKTAISIINDAGYSSIFRVIKGDTFNIPSGGDYKGIYGENNYKLLVEGNTFNMPQTSSSTLNYSGIYLKNNLSMGIEAAAEENEIPISPFNISILRNTFNNGSAGIILANYINNLIPYYITGNTFSNNSLLGILGMKITGHIKNNVTLTTNIPMGIHLIESSPDIFNNVIATNNIALHLTGNSYPNLSPNIYEDNMIWKGGKNTLTSFNGDAVQLASVGNVSTDWGNNNFIISDIPYFHIYGWIDSSVHTYYTRDNCWIYTNSTNSRVRLTRYPTQSQAAVIDFNYGFDCDSAIGPGEWNVDYLGNGMFDSVFVTDDISTEPYSESDLLYFQAAQYMDISDFVSAITAFKGLIDDYPSSNKLSHAAVHLYSCYEFLDTINEQNYRYTLYGDLKDYLEDKLEAEIYSSYFEDIIYDQTLMCEANMGAYNTALNGYEFLSLYHPDPDIRLSASWNYEEIEALLESGNGGGNQLQISNDKLQIEEKRLHREIKRINEVIKDDPVMRKLKKRFDKNYTERKLRIEIQINNMTKDVTMQKEYMKRSTELDNLKEDRAKRNLFESGNLSKEQLEKRRLDDMALSVRDIRNELITDSGSQNIPVEYRLAQNFPNPFNPVTNISFDIANDNVVRLKVYDILGKEVKVIVNEFRQAGSYKVTFDGTNLSSGIYFYKLEAGDFVQVRKMLLVK